MSILTLHAPRVIRSFARVLPPVKETHVAPRPAADFAAGIDPESSYALSSILPKTDGFGLTGEEWDRVAGARNRARAAYKADCPEAGCCEVERVAEKAAQDELRRTLQCRPAAKGEIAKPAAVLPATHRVDAAAKPLARPVQRPVRKLTATIRPTHTAADEAWWSANSPSCRLGFYVVGGVDPFDIYANTIAALDYDREDPAACLSDDFNDALATGCREGGDR